ncbi:MAG: CinA family protein [Deltaproteobacteria bacterium]|nr:CinA family protein [Deltaproteobacteria bacterium]
METKRNAITSVLGHIRGALLDNGLTLAVAESCTGGLLSNLITNAPGSSRYFIGGVVAYDNKVKTRLLGVQETTLERYGAVSMETAVEMAVGARGLLKSDISVGITGIAGPDGGSPDKPAGTVCVAVDFKGQTIVKQFRFKGARLEIKKQSAKGALDMLVESLLKSMAERAAL